MNATRLSSLGVIMVGVLIGSGRASEAGLINYSFSGYEGVGLLTPPIPFPVGSAFDHVSLSMTVDTSTIVNDPAHSALSPGYVTGSALTTLTVSDNPNNGNFTIGELTTNLMAHAEVFQSFSPFGGLYVTEIDFIADSGSFLGRVIGQCLIPEFGGNPLPVTYDLKSPYGPAGSDSGGIFYQLPTSQGTVQLGVTSPDDPNPTTFLNFQATAVPEPSSLALCGVAGVVGLLTAGALRRRHA